MTAVTADIEGTPAPTPAAEPFSAPRIKRFALYFAIGLVILCINFPKFLARTIDLNVSDPTLHAILMAPIQIVQACLSVVIGQHQAAFFERAIGASFFMLWLLLAALAVLSIRRRSAKMLGYCIAGMVAGYLTLHLLAWLAVTVVVVVGGAIYAVGWVGSGIFNIAWFLARYTWPLFVIAGLVFVFRNYLPEIIAFLRAVAEWVRRQVLRIVIAVAAIALAVVVVRLLIIWVIIPLINLLTPVVQFIWTVITWIFFVIFAVIVSLLAIGVLLISLALVGSLLVSQLQAGWRAARSLRDMLVAGFAIGSSLTLIVLVSVATPALADALDRAWVASFLFGGVSDQTHFLTDLFASTLPARVKEFVFLHLTSMQAPGFDTFIFLVVMVFSLFSAVSRAFSANPAVDEQVSLSFVATEYLKMAGGLFVALVLIFAAAETGDSHE